MTKELEIKRMEILGCIKNLWIYQLPHRRRQLFLLCLLMLVGGVAELISLGAIVPFISILANPDLVNKYPILLRLCSRFGVNQSMLSMWVSLFFAAAIIVSALIRIKLLQLTNRYVFGLGADLSSDLYEKALHRPYQFHINHNSSEIIGGIYKARQVSQHFILPLALAFVALIQSIFIVLLLVWIDPLAALLGASIFGLSYFLVGLRVRKIIKENGEVLASSENIQIQEIQEGLGGIRDVILEDTQNIHINYFKKINLRYMEAISNGYIFMLSPRYFLEGAGLLIITFFALYQVLHNGNIANSLPILAALGFGAQKLMPLVQTIYAGWNSATTNLQAVRDVLEFLKVNRPPQSNSKSLSFNSDIQFRDVNFSYSGDLNHLVLNNLNLVIPRGTNLGIIGETGSGKSTMVDILMGLLTPSTGLVLIDGKSLSADTVKAWQKKITHVPQAIFLSDGSIAENIAYGCEKSMIDMNRVRAAACAAQISEYIDALPEKYETAVGERGIKLSGGQKQRVGIARALYRRSEVLVLDEATSALDDHTEKLVMDGIKKFSPSATKIIIAHRTSTLNFCDIKVEIKNGQIIEVQTSLEKFVKV